MRLAQASFALLFCAALGTALACNKTSLLGASDVKDTFSHACNTDDDCTLAFFGGTCGICTSSNGAIAKSEQPAYQRAYNAARAHCPAAHAVGDCAASYGVSQCTAAKTCAFVACTAPPKDEHHCRPGAGPPAAP